METELQQIKTMSLREYIHDEISRLRQECLQLFDMLSEEIEQEQILEILKRNHQLIALQEIAHRLEYGFTTDEEKQEAIYEAEMAAADWKRQREAEHQDVDRRYGP